VTVKNGTENLQLTMCKRDVSCCFEKMKANVLLLEERVLKTFPER